MFQTPTIADLNLGVALPSVFLALYATVLLVIDLFIEEENKIRTAWLAIAGLIVTFILNLLVYTTVDEAFYGMFVADPFSAFLNIIVILTAIISILLAIDYMKRVGAERGEFYVLILFTSAGIMFMGHANNLVVVFVGLELLSIPLYILAAFRYPDARSEESGMKYLILGAFSSAFFVFGSALVYGATGTTSLPAIFDVVAADQVVSPVLLIMGAGLVLVGLGFKVAAVPFHMWTPDVYEGAPTPVTAFMSVGAKVGGFAALLRIMIVALPMVMAGGEQVHATWQLTVGLLAAATLILSNFVAISQTNIKRLLAYSSIAHAGYILMAVAAAGTVGYADIAAQAALVYLMAYMFTNLGAFGIAMALERPDGSGTTLEDFVGLGRSQPALALIMAFFMLSLTGIPLTAGFIGKWLVFNASIQSGMIWLAIIGVLTSVISAFYYVRIIVNMFLRDGDGDPAPGLTPYLNLGIYLSFAGTLVLGILPFLVTNLANSVTIAAVP
ncbi:MAG: NADH-quinone oxidoreductase subunit N [Anaerolineae bacterium]|nr:NADH-quinone oxidoreductase subunit N [Anaerolineae bacterium]